MASTPPPLAERVRAHEAQGKPFIAFEYFPPKTESGLANLLDRFGRMRKQDPLYGDITWGAGGSTSELTLDIARRMQNEYNFEANMHLTCTNMPEEKITTALEGAKDAGIRNIVALRGDPPVGQEEWKATEGGFTCALDLVRHIRAKYGDYFTISVAGYPEGHPNVINKVEPGQTLSAQEQGRVVELDGEQYVCSDKDYEAEMAYLKQKVDAGANMIITQMFFDVTVFLQFVKDCRARGIDVPIIPGLMVIQNYGGFKRMTAFCKSRVPLDIRTRLAEVQDDSNKVREVGIEIGTAMCRQLLDNGVVGLHFYCLNLEKVTYGILRNLGMLKEVDEETSTAKATVPATPAETKSVSGEAALADKEAAATES